MNLLTIFKKLDILSSSSIQETLKNDVQKVIENLIIDILVCFYFNINY